MRVELPRRPLRPDSILLVVALISSVLTVGMALAATPPSAHHATLIVFAKHRLAESEWTDLFAALRKGQRNAAATTPALAGEAEFLRGDKVAPGLQVDKPITVYLQGDCTLAPRPWKVAMGPLGWVLEDHGQIAPYVHVDCAEIVNLLMPLARRMNSGRRNVVMAEAMARVILHEWIHIATQSAGHSAHGISKSQFGIADLLAEDEELQRSQAKRDRKDRARL
jgi:hypothetical protein